MTSNVPILTISGMDGKGLSGIQSDVKTISDLKGYALAAITCLTIEDEDGQYHIEDMPQQMIISQVKSLIRTCHPKVVKIGLVRDAATICALRNEVIACSKLVCAPGIHSSDGRVLVSDEAVTFLREYLVPETLLLMLRCSEAQRMLGFEISTDDDMVRAAEKLEDMGAKWVLLRGGHQADGRLRALLHSNSEKRFFSSYNTAIWQQHGVGGALSSAIATRIGHGDDVPTAVSRAHEYIHSQVVYSVANGKYHLRPADVYGMFMSHVAQHYYKAHDVAFYADKLSISPRYLSQITATVISKTPKQVISDYLIDEAIKMIENSRLTVQEISISLGFPSQAIFSVFFKRMTGYTPSEYRRK